MTSRGCPSDRGHVRVAGVLFREAEAQRFEALIAASSCRLSVANVLEAALVVEGRGRRQAGDALDEFLAVAAIAAAPISRCASANADLRLSIY